MKTTHVIRKNHAGDSLTHDYARVSLPAVPGVEIDGDRSETDPSMRVIRGKRRPAHGAALSQLVRYRVEMFRAALIEVATGDEK